MLLSADLAQSNNQQMTLVKLSITCLLPILIFAFYDPALSSEFASISMIAYEDPADIGAWNCSLCSKFSLSHVTVFSNDTLDIVGLIGYYSHRNAVIISAGGTGHAKNLIADLDFNLAKYPACDKCYVHDGFYRAYLEVSDTVKAQLQSIMLENPTAYIYLTGHSLGAALSVLAALDIKTTFGRVDAVYTYGMPRVGNKPFAQYFDHLIPTAYRVVHYADVIPRLPPMAVLGYRHAGTQIWYTQNMEEYETCEAEDPDCSNSVSLADLTVAEHFLRIYMRLPASGNS